MCGIIACRTHRSAVNYLLPALHRLEYRGYDSVGIAVTTIDGDIARLRAVGRVEALEAKIGQADPAQWNGCGIGHTRWATHGPVTESNAHPHQDCTGRIALVHNGIIDEPGTIRERLTKTGHYVVSAVDSELLAHLIEEGLRRDGGIVDAVANALDGVQGSWALAVLDRLSGRIVVASQRSPLLVAHTQHGDFAASDIAAIADWTDDFSVLEDGDVVELGNLGTWCNKGSAARPRPSRRCEWVGSDLALAGHSASLYKYTAIVLSAFPVSAKMTFPENFIESIKGPVEKV